MRLYPNGQYTENETLTSNKHNRMLNAYAEVVAGSLTGINFGPHVIPANTNKLAPAVFNKTYIATDASTVTLNKGDINGGINIVTDFTQTFELKEGWVFGALNFGFTRYGEEDPELPYYEPAPEGAAVGVRVFLLLNGNIIAETDRITGRTFTAHLPFAVPCITSQGTFEVGIKTFETTGDSEKAAQGGTGEEQVNIFAYHLHVRNKKR